MSTPISTLVEQLGVSLTIRDDDLVTDAVVIAKVVEGDGTERLAISWSDGCSWMLRLGMITAAAQMESVASFDGPRDDDDD